MDKPAFFAAIRPDFFSGGLAPHQVKRIECLLDAMAAAGWPLSYASYALATAHHETAQWKHMKELGGDAYFRRMYDKSGSRPKVAATLGNTEAGDGVKFAGRGYVQLTGRANYVKAGRALGLDLVKEPGLVEEPETAARVLIWGMSTGAYTGKANRDYLAKSPPDYVNARRIINGTDKAGMIAGYAKLFQAALVAAGYGKPTYQAHETKMPKYEYQAPPKVTTASASFGGTFSPIPTPPPVSAPPVLEPTRNDGQFTAPKSEKSWWGSVVSKLLGKEP